jgi:hypothetical protein
MPSSTPGSSRPKPAGELAPLHRLLRMLPAVLALRMIGGIRTITNLHVHGAIPSFIAPFFSSKTFFEKDT